MTVDITDHDERLLSLFAVALEKVRDHRQPEVAVTLASSLREDLGLDSFAALELLFELEEQAGIRIPQESAVQFQTVADVVAYVRKTVARPDMQEDVAKAAP